MNKEIITRALEDHIRTQIEDSNNHYDFVFDENLVKDFALSMIELSEISGDKGLLRDLHDYYASCIEFDLDSSTYDGDYSWQNEAIGTLIILGEDENKIKELATKYHQELNECLEAGERLKSTLPDVNFDKYTQSVFGMKSNVKWNFEYMLYDGMADEIMSIRSDAHTAMDVLDDIYKMALDNSTERLNIINLKNNLTDAINKANENKDINSYEALIGVLDDVDNYIYEYYETYVSRDAALDDNLMWRSDFAHDRENFFDALEEKKIKREEDRTNIGEFKSETIKYWSNGCGDLFTPLERDEDNLYKTISENKLPAALKEAWNHIWSDNYGSYCYLVERTDKDDDDLRYGILLTNEYPKDEDYTLDFVSEKSKMTREMLTDKAMENCSVSVELTSSSNELNMAYLHVFLPWNTPKENVEKIADFLLDVAYYRGVNTYEDYKNYADNLSGTEFINTLMPGYKDRIKEALFEILPEITDHYDEYDINEIMSGRLCDLEDNMNWREALKDGDIRKDVPYFKNIKDEIEEER